MQIHMSIFTVHLHPSGVPNLCHWDHPPACATAKVPVPQQPMGTAPGEGTHLAASLSPSTPLCHLSNVTSSVPFLVFHDQKRMRQNRSWGPLYAFFLNCSHLEFSRVIFFSGLNSSILGNGSPVGTSAGVCPSLKWAASFTCVLIALKMLFHIDTFRPASNHVVHRMDRTGPHLTDRQTN